MTDQPSTALAKANDAPSLDLSAMYQGMIDLAKDPSVDPQKMSAMLDMQERMIDRQNLTAYRRAMHGARSKMPRITKDGKITNKTGQVQSRFAHYEAIDKIVRPLVEAEGLTYGFDTVSIEGGRVGVTCIVSHVDGHEERFGPMPLAVDTTGAKNATQGAGSATSYGKRYTLCAAFNIVTDGEDDDGREGRAATTGGQWEELLDAARKSAINGTEAYSKWFQSRSNMEKGWLMDEGHHASLKTAAADHD
jgi:hypothetical protein